MKTKILPAITLLSSTITLGALALNSVSAFGPPGESIRNHHMGPPPHMRQDSQTGNLQRGDRTRRSDEQSTNTVSLPDGVSTTENWVKITTDDTYRYIQSNGLANHATGEFPTRGNPHTISAQNQVYRVPLNPVYNGSAVEARHVGIALNGVLFEPGTAETWNNDRDSGWNYEAIQNTLNLGLDDNFAHVQSTGKYHYHGVADALVNLLPSDQNGTQIGWASDGFPIYYRADIKSSYRIKSGSRPNGPGGNYDGTFTQDHEYVEGLGDLDTCNGVFVADDYLYYATDTFPFFPRCANGTPDSSFAHRSAVTVTVPPTSTTQNIPENNNSAAETNTKANINRTYLHSSTGIIVHFTSEVDSVVQALQDYTLPTVNSNKITIGKSNIADGIAIMVDSTIPETIQALQQKFSTKKSAQTPNVLLIIADDMGLDVSPCYNLNNNLAPMPNLEALCAQGLVFDNVWASPVCAPTRAGILTGKYGFDTGVLSAETHNSQIGLEETSLHTVLKNAPTPYRSATIGKWHIGGRDNGNADNPGLMGVEYYAGLLKGGVQSYTDWDLTINGKTEKSSEYTTTKITNLAIDWLAQDQDNPWFLWLAYNAPHTPFHLPPSNLHSYGDLPTDEESLRRNSQQYYFAMLEALDTEMGRVLNTLSDEVRANTVVIFMGDNGTGRKVVQTPYDKLQGKGSLYQGGLNVPFVVSGPGVKTGRETELLSTVDLFATIADLAGTSSSTATRSQSFTPLLSGNNANIRDFVYSEIESESTQGYAIRNQSHKLIVFNNGDEEFYDLASDPYEKNNLMEKSLSQTQQEVYEILENEALKIRS